MSLPLPGAAPEVLPGTVLHLAAPDWAYGRGCAAGQTAAVVVTGLRHDLSRYYGGQHIWADGHDPRCRGDHPPCRQLLVRTDALRRLTQQSARPTTPPQPPFPR